MKSLNNNGVSTCVAGQENYVYFNPMPDYARKAGIANTTTAVKKMASCSAPLPRHWKYVGNAGINGYNVKRGT